ncbi:hypothetical protein ACEPAI_5597 [Sanghuangporus weigelae]
MTLSSFFDTAERGALTLTLSTNDPFDAVYLTQEGVPLYLVSTRKHSRSSGGSSKPGLGFGYLDAEVTTIKRVRTGPPSSSSTSSASVNKPDNHDARRNARKSWPPRSYTNRQCPRRGAPHFLHRRARSSSMLSMSTPLDTIDEVADGVDVDADRGVCSDDSGRSSGSGSDSEPASRSDSSNNTILVATIERRPFSLSPARVRFNGCEGSASKFLQRERPFSSTRCFVSMTGDLLKWQLSTPVPKLYNSNKVRLAKYCAPFLPSKGMLSSSHAVLEIAQGIESDRALDEIIVTLLLTFLL